MQTSTLLSVVSSALVVAALSSSAVQLQQTGVVVARTAPVVQVQQAVPAAAPASAVTEQPVAAPARPAYVQVAQDSPAVALAPAAGEGATVDVLACSQQWSEAGECLGQQTAVLRGAVVAAVERAVAVPAGAPHVRVSVHGGEVAVGATAVALPRP